jgi:hypothetical protein
MYKGIIKGNLFFIVKSSVMRAIIIVYFLLGSLVVFGQSEVEWVVEPSLEFDEVSHFSEGLARVKKDDKYAYINTSGELVTQLFDKAWFFSEGFSWVKKNDKYGYINTSGKLVTQIEFDYVRDFSAGFARVKKNGKYGYINTSGKLVIQIEFDEVTNFSAGFARVKKNGKYGYINTSGKLVTQIEFDEAHYFSAGLAKVKKNGKYGYINTSGKLVIQIEVDDAWHFSEGLVKVKKNGKYGYINTSGKLVTQIEFDYAWDFSAGLATVRKNGKYGYINTSGKLVTQITFDYAESLSKGFSMVRKNGKYGYINTSGKLITQIEFDEARHFSSGLAIVKKNGKYGYINTSGKLVIQIEVDNASSFSSGLSKVKKNGKYGYINTSGKLVTQIEFDDTWDFVAGLAIVKKNGKYGYINTSGKLVTQIEFDGVWNFSKDLAWVKKNGKLGIIRHLTKPKINFPNLPKTIEITDVHQFDLEICIQSPYSATETKLYVNNQLYPLRGIGKGSDDKVCSETIKKRITLSGYNIHTIKVVSTNEFGTTTAEKLIETLKGYDTPITIPKGKNYALFIGITDYQHHNDLMNPINDCEALIKVLTNKYNFDSKNIATLYDEVATRKNVLDKIEQYATDLSPSDNLLIYFAGHGFYDATHKRGSWIPYEATQTATLSDMITNNEVKDKLCLLNGNNVYVIADACFSGSMRSTTLDIPKDLEPWIRELQQQRSIRVFASGQLERVDDNYKDTNHSPFAHFLLKILQENTSDVLPAYTIEYGIIKEIQPETKQLPNGVYIDACNLEENKGQFIFYRKK